MGSRTTAPRTLIVIAFAVSIVGALAVSAAAQIPSEDPCLDLDGVNERCPAWSATYDEEGSQAPMDVELDGSGETLFAAGFSAVNPIFLPADQGTLTPGSVEPSVVAYDTADGRERWRASAPLTSYDFGYAISLGDLLYATGGACTDLTEGGSCDLAVRAYDPSTGEVEWTNRFDGPGHGLDAGFDVASAPGADGQDVVFVTGRSEDPSTNLDFITRAYDGATGELVWQRRLDTARSIDYGQRIVVDDAGGTVFVTGTSGTRIRTIAYDARDGEMLWTQTHAAGMEQSIGAWIVASGERVFVTGVAAQPGGGGVAVPDYRTLAYDASTGEELWSATYDFAAGPDQPFSITSDEAGDKVFVAGYSRNLSYDSASVAYDGATGDELWVSRFEGPGRDADADWSVELTPDGDSLLVGGMTYLRGPGYLNMLREVDANTGQQRWFAVARGVGPRNAVLPSYVAVAPDGATAYMVAQGGNLMGTDPNVTAYAYRLTPG